MRAQFGAAVPRASIAAVLPANLDKAAAAIAPGGLISIFGSNLAKLPADLSGWTGQQLPIALNGVKVTVGGMRAPLVYVSPNQINAQAPVELAAGVQTVMVDNGAGPSAAFSVNVARDGAGDLLFSRGGGAEEREFHAALRRQSGARRRRAAGLRHWSRPDHAGDPHGSAFRQATPWRAPRRSPPPSAASRRPSSTRSRRPGFAGLYQVAVTVPAGVTGNVALQIAAGTAASNSVTIPVQ